METKEKKLQDFIESAEGIIRFYEVAKIKNKKLVNKLKKEVEQARKELIEIQDNLEERRNLICSNIYN